MHAFPAALVAAVYFLVTALTASAAPHPVLRRAAAASSVMGGGSPSASASASAPGASGSLSPYSQNIIGALRSAGLTQLANIVSADTSNSIGGLQGRGNFTVFAPNDAAFNSVNLNTSNIQEILAYHILPGSYPASEIPTNGTHLIIPSLQGEPVSFYRDVNGTTGLIGQNATVLSNTTVQNLLLKVIPRVLTIPGPIPEVLVSNSNGSDLVELGEQYLPKLVSRLNDTSSNYTVFAPTNQAISDAQSDLDSLMQSDGNQSLSIVQGHILNQVVYSTNITDGLSAQTLNGQNLSLSVSNGSVTVNSNGGSANVVGTDYIASNGVVHFINAVLLPEASNPSGGASMGGSGGTGGGPGQPGMPGGGPGGGQGGGSGGGDGGGNGGGSGGGDGSGGRGGTGGGDGGGDGGDGGGSSQPGQPGEPGGLSSSISISSAASSASSMLASATT